MIAVYISKHRGSLALSFVRHTQFHLVKYLENLENARLFQMSSQRFNEQNEYWGKCRFSLNNKVYTMYTRKEKKSGTIKASKNVDLAEGQGR